MNLLICLAFIFAAVLEVGGDAMVRAGLRTSKIVFIVIGFLSLGCYGLMVNTIKWDFSRLLGIYVAFFTLVSVLFGQLAFHELIPPSTWIGCGIIIIGALVIQFGPR